MRDPKRRILIAVMAIGMAVLGRSGVLGLQAQEKAGIAVERPWARATPGAAPTAAAYLTLVNRGAEADRLTAVASPVARSAELHNHVMEGNVAAMRPVAEIVVPPGGRIELKPAGLHVMLIGMRRPLKEGESFAVTLEFARAGKVEVAVPVAKIGAMGPPGS
jgi:copper(I)-binding protein